MVTWILYEKLDDIVDWLKIDKPVTKSFSLDFGYKIGEGVAKIDYLNGNNKISSFQKAQIVLTKHPKGRFELNGRRFDIKTAYPIL